LIYLARARQKRLPDCETSAFAACSIQPALVAAQSFFHGGFQAELSITLQLRCKWFGNFAYFALI
jgi:hypothetical protein